MHLPSRLASGLLAAALPLVAAVVPSSAASAAPARAAAPVALPARVVDCQGDAARIKPRTLIFACGDGGVVAVRLHWTDWGRPRAHATGYLAINDCTPDCAVGHYHDAPARVTLTRLHTFPDGRTRYRYLTIYAPKDGPAQSVLRSTLPG